MISSTFGAPLRGSTRGGQYGFDCAALRSILPSNFDGGTGICSPLMATEELGEPGTPVVCWARAVVASANSEHVTSNALVEYLLGGIHKSSCWFIILSLLLGHG
jgi:hypothetical protein